MIKKIAEKFKTIFFKIAPYDFWQKILKLLVLVGILGPVGASAFNFLTDFVPILNSLRILRK